MVFDMTHIDSQGLHMSIYKILSLHETNQFSIQDILISLSTSVPWFCLQKTQSSSAVSIFSHVE
jgi:hypothetical protein